tara:strand:- start:1459 stop:1947 length:489 start_codon:yes stop_codon:yes gene_type:complete
MCDPVSLAVASASVSLIGSQAQVDAQNQASLNNAHNARGAAAYGQDQEMESYVETNRQLLMTSMDRALSARSATDLAMVSMFETGGGGQVMTDMLQERSSVEARNLYRDRLERTSLKIQTGRNLQGQTDQAKARIASQPTTSLNMGHIMSAASSGIMGYAAG